MSTDARISKRCHMPCNCLNAWRVVHFLMTGLGNLHVLGDGLILELLQLLEARDLAALARTSKALYCFCDAEDIWKGLVLVVSVTVLHISKCMLLKSDMLVIL